MQSKLPTYLLSAADRWVQHRASHAGCNKSPFQMEATE